MRTIARTIAVLIVVSLMYVGLQASALVTEPGPCLGYELGVVPFDDVDMASPHRLDIECISGWGITVNVGTYDPKGNVSRWQMALFLTRTLSLVQAMPSGDPQGFLDIAALPADQQTAINQLAELSITTGVSPTAYDPYGAVTRWQMALFLKRLVNAAAVALPAQTDQSFTDLGHLSAESQAAINQLKLLGISMGTSPTTFSPDLVVTREQMASFLARTLAIVWYLDAAFEADTTDCDASGNCTGSGSYWTGLPFELKAGWFQELPFPSPVEQQEFFSAGTSVEIRIDGAAVTATERQVNLNGAAYRTWVAEFPSGLTGTHTIEFVYRFAGQLDSTEIYTFDFSL